jgi:glutamate--cysteine ligase catalytic subunit
MTRKPGATVALFGVIVGWLQCLLCHCAILRKGNPLPWSSAKQYLQSVRSSGASQFANHYLRSKDIETPSFVWGDEIEYGVFKYDNACQSYDLSMRGENIVSLLSNVEETVKHLPLCGVSWQLEYGSWMVETVPREPFGGFASELLLVEKSMQLRRKRLHSVLNKNEIAPSISNFPLLGCAGLPHARDEKDSSTSGNSKRDKLYAVAKSKYVKDAVINPHPRFATLTRNIQQRRQRNVDIKIPKADNSGDMIHMDAMAFGMGSCCVQVTMQCKNDQESRFVHDQLTTFAPLFLALSASTPIHKGELAATGKVLFFCWKI